MRGENDTEKKHRRNALIAAMTSFLVPSALEGVNSYRHTQNLLNQKQSKKWSEFKKLLQPGDILFSRGNPVLNGSDLGVKEQNWMTAAKGGVFYHPSVFAGGNRQFHSADIQKGFVKNPIKDAWSAEKQSSYGMQDAYAQNTRDWIAYRPPENDAKEALKKLNIAAKYNPGYKSRTDLAKHALKYLAGVKESTVGSICKAGKAGGGVVCTEAVSEAFPKLFQDRLIGPEEMQKHKKLKFIGRYNPVLGNPTLAARINAHVIHPSLKNLKWVLPGAAAGYLASNLLHEGNS